MHFKWHQQVKWLASESKIPIVIKSKGHILMMKKDAIKNIYFTFWFSSGLCPHIRFILIPIFIVQALLSSNRVLNLINPCSPPPLTVLWLAEVARFYWPDNPRWKRLCVFDCEWKKRTGQETLNSVTSLSSLLSNTSWMRFDVN